MAPRIGLLCDDERRSARHCNRRRDGV